MRSPATTSCAAACCAAVVVVWMTSVAMAGVEVFVAPSGDDANTGSESKPFATLEKARDAVRELRRAKPEEAVTVWLTPGVYPRDKSFVLEAEDSGTAASPVVYAARPGKSATLWGARVLDRAWFEPVKDKAILDRIVDVASRDKIVRVDLRAHGIADLGEIRRRGYSKNDLGGVAPPWLYVAGQRMTLARWPNADEKLPQFLHAFAKDRPGVVSRASIADAGPKFGEPGYLDRGPIYTYSFDRPKHWAAAKDVYLDGIFNASWEWSYNRVAKIDDAAKTISMRFGECMGVKNEYSGDFFFAENLLEEIDKPGEFWIDRDAGVLYLYPPASFEKADARAVITTLAEPMIGLRGASHVTFRGLELAFGRDFGVKADKGESITVDHCTIRDFAGGGVTLNGKNHRVSACRITGSGGAGVTLQGGDPFTLEPGNCVVEDCAVLDTAWYHRVYHASIVLRGVANRASHNRVRGNPHLTVSAAGNDQVIELNDLGQVCTEFSDMGVVYIHTGWDPLQRGTIVRRNYIHDIGKYPLQQAVYPDNGTMGVTIEENIFARVGGATPQTNNCRTINNNSGAYILARDNIFIDCPMPYILSAHSGGKNHDKQLAAWKKLFEQHPLADLPHVKRYAEMAKFWEEERRYPTTNTYERNLVWNPKRALTKSWRRGKGEPLPVVDGAIKEYDGLRVKDNWVATKDPGFVNAEKGDYTFQPDAEVFKRIPGFKAIPFHEIGPRGAAGASGGASGETSGGATTQPGDAKVE